MNQTQGTKQLQITLNQAELEEAIEDYVRSQININDDQDITIDLKATRGAEGNTANIDIRKAGAKPAKTTKPAYRGNKPGPKPKAAQPEPAPEPEPETDTTVEDEAPEQETQATEPDVTPDADDEDVVETEAEPEKTEEKPAPARGSIFSRAS